MFQNPVGQPVGDQFDGADFLIGAGVHLFQHLTGNFGLVVVMQPLVNAGNGFDVG